MTEGEKQLFRAVWATRFAYYIMMKPEDRAMMSTRDATIAIHDARMYLACQNSKEGEIVNSDDPRFWPVDPLPEVLR